MAEGDRVSVLATAHGKHVGEFFGIPGTGKDLSVPLADFFRVEGGKVNEHWGVMDSGALLMQMGVVQPPGT
jgi:predicted ester cyclase